MKDVFSPTSQPWINKIDVHKKSQTTQWLLFNDKTLHSIFVIVSNKSRLQSLFGASQRYFHCKAGLYVTQSSKRAWPSPVRFNVRPHYFSSCHPYLRDRKAQLAYVLWLMSHWGLTGTKDALFLQYSPFPLVSVCEQSGSGWVFLSEMWRSSSCWLTEELFVLSS